MQRIIDEYVEVAKVIMRYLPYRDHAAMMCTCKSVQRAREREHSQLIRAEYYYAETVKLLRKCNRPVEISKHGKTELLYLRGLREDKCGARQVSYSEETSLYDYEFVNYERELRCTTYIYSESRKYLYRVRTAIWDAAAGSSVEIEIRRSVRADRGYIPCDYPIAWDSVARRSTTHACMHAGA